MQRPKIIGFFMLLTLCVGMLSLSSCSSSEEESERTSHAFISGVTLGSIRRVVTIPGSTTQSTTTFSGSAFPMSIDQRNRVIENKEPLLYGAQLKAVLLTITYQGSYVAYRVAGDKNAPWIPYNANDSIDLTHDIQICVNSNDYQSGTYYTLRVHVQQQDADQLEWSQMHSGVPELTGMDVSRAIMLGGKLVVFGTKNGTVVAATRDEQGQWDNENTDLPADAEFNTLRTYADSAYISTQSGDVYVSKNAVSWTKKGNGQPGLQLAAVTANRLYAIVNGTMQYASLDSLKWFTDSLYDKASDLPQKVQDALVYEQSNGTQRIVLFGKKQESDSTLLVWNKSWMNLQNVDSVGWMFYNQSSENTIPCPHLNYFNVMRYDDRIFAFGGAPISGFKGRQAMDYIYISNDNGLTWRATTSLLPPAALKGTDNAIAATVDAENYIWIIANNNVWRGRINRLGFEKL